MLGLDWKIVNGWFLALDRKAHEKRLGLAAVVYDEQRYDSTTGGDTGMLRSLHLVSETLLLTA